jgi:hypothetical protein
MVHIGQSSKPFPFGRVHPPALGLSTASARMNGTLQGVPGAVAQELPPGWQRQASRSKQMPEYHVAQCDEAFVFAEGRRMFVSGYSFRYKFMSSIQVCDAAYCRVFFMFTDGGSESYAIADYAFTCFNGW